MFFFVVLNVHCQSVPIMKKVPPQIIRHPRCAEHLIELTFKPLLPWFPIYPPQAVSKKWA